MVLLALLRDPARHPEQVAGRDRDVLLHHLAVLRAMARYLARPLDQVPSPLPVVLLAVHPDRDRARLSGLQTAGGALRVLGPYLHRLLLYPSVAGAADCRRHRDANAAAALDQRGGARRGACQCRGGERPREALGWGAT